MCVCVRERVSVRVCVNERERVRERECLHLIEQRLLCAVSNRLDIANLSRDSAHCPAPLVPIGQSLLDCLKLLQLLSLL